jgi:hypothetical protein
LRDALRGRLRRRAWSASKEYSMRVCGTFEEKLSIR